jgi:hypothetical protein
VRVDVVLLLCGGGGGGGAPRFEEISRPYTELGRPLRLRRTLGVRAGGGAGGVILDGADGGAVDC